MGIWQRHQNFKRLSGIAVSGFVFCLLGNTALAGTSLSVSDEAYGTTAAVRAKADALDDAWGASFPTGSYRPDLFAGASGLTGSKSFTDPSGATYQVSWEVGRLNQLGPGVPTSTTFLSATGGSATIGPSTKIQSAAPSPYSGDTRLSTSASGSGLKAIRFDFTASTTDIYKFGVYVGDLESRPNNGTVGRVIIYDTAGAVIGDHQIIYTGTVKTAGADTTYMVVEPIGSPTGPANNDNGDWGNGTTAFLAISSDTKIGSVVIHVGDDDHTTNNTGSTEQLGLVGFQVPAEPYTPGSAQLTAAKTVSLYDTASTAYAIPGADVVYAIDVKNEGNGPADNDSLFLVDAMPANLSFFNGDMDGAGPATGAVKFTDAGSGLSFNVANDVRYSNAGSPPASFAACSYIPAAGYDPAVSYVCLNPKGVMENGSPFPEFTVEFRAQIK